MLNPSIKAASGTVLSLLQTTSARPPRDLNALLQEIRVPADVDRCHWARAFRSHLQATAQQDAEAMLDFAIVANVLRVKTDEGRAAPAWRKAELDRERAELLEVVGHSFFHPDALTPLPLANGVLREELVEAIEAVIRENNNEERGESVEAAFELVWDARCDHKVWKGGLDHAYNAFLATKPTPPSALTAVLLSIM